MAIPVASWHDGRGTTATSHSMCEGGGRYPVAPDRGMLEDIGDVLLSFASVCTSTWSPRIPNEVKFSP